jgi:hypothetical protein
MIRLAREEKLPHYSEKKSSISLQQLTNRDLQLILAVGWKFRVSAGGCGVILTFHCQLNVHWRNREGKAFSFLNLGFSWRHKFLLALELIFLFVIRLVHFLILLVEAGLRRKWTEDRLALGYFPFFGGRTIGDMWLLVVDERI